MHRKTWRPPHCEPGNMNDPRELGQRLRLSRERLAASDLAAQGQAWRLWAACADATFGYAREADQIYLTTLARNAADVHRNAASRIMRRFDELGVFGWEPAPRGSHGISLLTLPPLHAPSKVHEDVHALPTVHEEPATCTAHGALQSIELSVEGPHSQDGAQQVAGIGHRSSGLQKVSESWEAERHARLQPMPGPEDESYDWDAYEAQREADYRAAHERE